MGLGGGTDKFGGAGGAPGGGPGGGGAPAPGLPILICWNWDTGACGGGGPPYGGRMAAGAPGGGMPDCGGGAP